MCVYVCMRAGVDMVVRVCVLMYNADVDGDVNVNVDVDIAIDVICRCGYVC